jgi:hypothetical protein
MTVISSPPAQFVDTDVRATPRSAWLFQFLHSNTPDFDQGWQDITQTCCPNLSHPFTLGSQGSNLVRMGDAPRRGYRQGSTLPDLQRWIQNTNPGQPLEKHFAAGEEESARIFFAPQLNASSQPSGVPPSQHGSPSPCHHLRQLTRGFDTGSMSLALPGPGPPALVYSNGVAVQYAGMSFRPQIRTYSGQAYSSKMAMHQSLKRGQTHPSTSSPGHYYNPHGVSTPQACIQSQGQLAAGYTTLPKTLYGPNVDVHKSYPRPYLSTC